MKCRAALWYETPGAVPYVENFPSIQAVETEFRRMVDSWQQHGGSAPVGVIYPMDNDEPMMLLAAGQRGGIQKEAV